MAERYEELKYIRIPQAETAYGHDLVMEVAKRDDAWLTSPERTWDEVDGVLEGWLQPIQESFQVQNSERAKAYGLEELPSGNKARFLAYVELVGEYKGVGDDYLIEAKSLRDEYEREKLRIRSTVSGKGRQNQQIEKLYRERFNPAIGQAVERVHLAEGVKNLILRKAVMDIFSIKGSGGGLQDPLVNDSFLRLILDMDSKLGEMSEEDEQFKQEEVQKFVGEMGTYLFKTRDVALFTRYAYRLSPTIISRRSECDVLADALDLVFVQHEFDELAGKMPEQVAGFGSNFLFFLKNRAGFLSREGSLEPFSYVALAYDLMTAVFYRSSPQREKLLGAVLDKLLFDVLSSTQGQQEWRRFSEKQSMLQISACAALAEMPGISEIDPKSADFISQLPQEVMDWAVSDEGRVEKGLSGYLTFLREREYLGSSKAVNVLFSRAAVSSDMRAIVGRMNSKGLEVVRRAVDVLGLLPEELFFDDNKIEVDLGAMLGGYLVPAEFKHILSGDKNRFEALQEAERRSRGLETRAYNREVFHDYLVYFIGEPGQDVGPAREENNYLWREILDNPNWLVSPRGDRFSNFGDPQLTDFGLDFITFRVDRQYPREHKVVFKLAGIDWLFNFWFDARKNFLGAERQILTVEPYRKDLFINILLKRLYCITSGKFSELFVGGNEDHQGQLRFDYKRAHYRYLVSTDSRPITMESHGAQVHAQEIREDYGIDIYAEIRRRRLLGTLKPNEFMTFVREVAPDHVSRNVLPNELKFDPDLITIPV